MINVTRTYLPSFEAYCEKIKNLWEDGWITNRGVLALELEQKLKEKLNVSQLLYVNNGMQALQVAIKALGLKGEIITTPFSYVATTSAIVWEGCRPIFADIEPETFCIDPAKIEALITPETSAILATHVFGFPCRVEAIQKIAEKHGLKVIYDGAHAFDAVYKGRSLLSYGDISICSFHATKLFHTVEGGAIICNTSELHEKVRLLHQFGHSYDEYSEIGTNAKVSEFHAAMGLCIVEDVPAIIERRQALFEYYRRALRDLPITYPTPVSMEGYNYAYFPIPCPMFPISRVPFLKISPPGSCAYRFFLTYQRRSLRRSQTLSNVIFQHKMKKVMIISDNAFLLNGFIDIFHSLQLQDSAVLSLGYSPSNSPVASFSEIQGIPCSSVNVKNEWKNLSESFDLIFSVHCKQLFPVELVTRVPCINIHPGLNPHNRGWFPQVFSIINGLPLGATLHLMDKDLDHGPVIAQKEVPIYLHDTSLTAYERVLEAELELLQTYLPSIMRGEFQSFPLNDEGNINLKRDFNALCELQLDKKQSIGQTLDLLRALTHGTYKNAWFTDPESGKRIYVSITLNLEE
jgi:dTDP-4-amino-4,6-dideoxygalactose transaminase/methionyl-tRNA formyltransferase